MLSYLIYVSWAHSGMDHNIVKNILDKAREENKKHDITGMLIYTGEQFIQYIEGQREELGNLYRNILNDKRHNDIQLVMCEDIKKDRLFRDWNMALLEDNEKTQSILEKYQRGSDNGKHVDYSALSSDEILNMFIEISVYYTLENKII